MGQRKYFMRKLAARRSALGGVGPREQRYSADITIGRAVDSLLLLVGEDFGDGPLGYAAWEPAASPTRRFVFPVEDVLQLVKSIRRKQAGVAGWTVSSATGGFEDNPEEPVSEIALLWFKSDEEPDFLRFEYNVLLMAETLAYAFAQKEILVALHSAGREDIVRVSPSGMPPPGEALDNFLKARGAK